MTDFRAKIISDIKKTGFPTELVVESIFNAREWYVNTHEYFIDSETQKGREIDCTGRFLAFEKKNNKHIKALIHVYVEVKKTEKPWIVFTSPKSKMEKMLTGQLVATQHISTRDALKSFHEIHPTHTYPRYGRAVHISFKSDGSTAFSAIVSASKAALEGHRNASKEEGFYNDESCEAFIYLPIVVVDGELFECQLNNKGEVYIDSVKYLPFRFNYKSPAYSDQYSCHLDIVSLNHFEEYITKIEESIHVSLSQYIKKVEPVAAGDS
ncbi:MAG: hypothetical protein PHO37_10085 [Kiritimatiellae bacterium]|nr:hypothetical protein [Kiritimatiellia bacterium]